MDSLEQRLSTAVCMCWCKTNPGLLPVVQLLEQHTGHGLDSNPHGVCLPPVPHEVPPIIEDIIGD